MNKGWWLQSHLHPFQQLLVELHAVVFVGIICRFLRSELLNASKTAYIMEGQHHGGMDRPGVVGVLQQMPPLRWLSISSAIQDVQQRRYRLACPFHRDVVLPWNTRSWTRSTPSAVNAINFQLDLFNSFGWFLWVKVGGLPLTFQTTPTTSRTAARMSCSW